MLGELCNPELGVALCNERTALPAVMQVGVQFHVTTFTYQQPPMITFHLFPELAFGCLKFRANFSLFEE
jgi:hypothetical protein